jgi:hypothetical protein
VVSLHKLFLVSVSNSILCVVRATDMFLDSVSVKSTCYKYCHYSAVPSCLLLPPCLIRMFLLLLWLYRPLLDRYRFFSFLILFTVGRTPWTGDQLVARPLPYIGQHKHRINANKHPCLEWDSKPRSQCSSKRRQLMP